MKDKPYYKGKVKGDKYPARLKGLGLKPLNRQRGLRGSTLGPANAGKTLSKKEQEAIEAELRRKGVL